MCLCPGERRVVGLNILHLFAMVRNDSMALIMWGSDEQSWVTCLLIWRCEMLVVWVG